MVNEVSDPTITGSAGVDYQDEIEQSRAPLMDHLIELRGRLIVCLVGVALAFVLAFIFSYDLYNLLTIPFVEAVAKHEGVASPTINYQTLGLFFARVKLSFFASIMMAFPILAWQLYAFVAPGLYRHERRSVYPFLIAIPFLFAAGILLVHQQILPMVMDFALSMEQPAEARGGADYALFIRVDEYLSLALTLIVGFGFAFQLPVVLTLLGRAGVIDAGFLRRNRKFAVVGIFLVAAILTPPDPVSQIALGLTILVLYEISIFMVATLGRDAPEKDEDDA